MLRIAMVSPLPPQRTGESLYTANLITELVRTGKIQVTALTGKDAEAIVTETGLVEVLNVWKGRNLLYPFVLVKHLKRVRPHIVHVQFGPHGEVYGGLFGEPMLLFLILCRLFGFRTTVTLHSTWMADQVVERAGTFRFLSHFLFFAKAAFRVYMRLLDWGTDVLQLSTVKTNSLLRKAFLRDFGYRSEKVVEIPHPCRLPTKQLDRKSASEMLGLPDRRIVLIFGFIRRGKGIDVAIKAMKQIRDSLPNTIMLIAGSPQDKDGTTYLQELLKLTTRLSLDDHVRFDTEFIAEERIPVYLSAASAILFPYTESVGASGPIHNYAGYGIPIVAADIGYHMRESIGGYVLLFKVGDLKSLAKRLVEILRNDNLATRLGQSQVSYAQRETWRFAANRTVEYYKRVLKI